MALPRNMAKVCAVAGVPRQRRSSTPVKAKEKPPAMASQSAWLSGQGQATPGFLSTYDRCSLQPASGAHGELTGLLAVRGYLSATGQQQRDLVLVPASAHGTNAAS